MLDWKEGIFMSLITERIVNISDHENKIRSSRETAELVLQYLENNNYEGALYFAKKHSLEMHELSEFEFVIERHKTIEN